MIGEVCSEHITNKQQEPKITAFVSQDENMIDAFQHDKDIYASIASIAFNVPYEKCLEFHPETHEYQPDGKARRGEAKTIVLGRPIRFQVLAGHRSYAPLAETCKLGPSVENIVNCITHRCAPYIWLCRK